MAKPAVDPIAYYSTPGPVTAPGKHAALLGGLPAEVGSLVEVVQGLLLHVHWAVRYGIRLSEERNQEAQLRTVEKMLGRIAALDDRPLTAARPLELRLIGNCRDFSTLLCALLRHQGIPARARCGFGAYFLPSHYEDHWVCEYWRADEARWVLVDAQLDAFQRRILGVRFDPLDVPRDQFITGGRAWQMARSGEADPESFGIFDMHGLWFIRGNVIRDLLALGKLEVLPWDHWGIMVEGDAARADPAGAEEHREIDRLAALTLAGDGALDEILAACQDEQVRPPSGWRP